MCQLSDIFKNVNVDGNPIQATKVGELYIRNAALKLDFLWNLNCTSEVRTCSTPITFAPRHTTGVHLLFYQVSTTLSESILHIHAGFMQLMDQGINRD